MAASNPLEFVAKLVDEMSGPAANVQAALEGIAAAAKKASTAQQNIKIPKIPTPPKLPAIKAPKVEGPDTTKALEKITGIGGLKEMVRGGAIVLAAAAAAKLLAILKDIVVEIGQFALKFLDARRSQQLVFEDLLKSSTAAKAVTEHVDALAATSPLAREEIAKMAEGLAKAGKSGAELDAALDAAVAKKVGSTGAKQMLSLGTQILKFKESLQNLFSGLDIEPLLKALFKFFGLFSQTTATGRALKTLVTAIGQKLLDWASNKAIPALVHGFKLAVIGALRLYIAFKTTDDALKDATGIGLVTGNVDALSTGLKVLYDIFIMMFNPLQGFIDLLTDLGVISGDTTGKTNELGNAMSTGVADGILSGKSNIVSAMADAVNGAIASAKSALGIASPSKVFAKMGGHVATGFARGVDAGTLQAQVSMQKLVQPQAPAGVPQGKGGNTITIDSIVINGDADQKQVRDGVLEAFMQALGPLQIESAA
jgi:hypothetical protein